MDLGFSTIPPSFFCDDLLDDFDLQRLGGLYSHLKKKYAAQRNDIMKEVLMDVKVVSHFNSWLLLYFYMTNLDFFIFTGKYLMTGSYYIGF